MEQQGQQFKYSAVIPVYRSEAIIAETISRTAAFFERMNLAYEIIAVNDGSPDHSWEILRQEAQLNHNIVAINLLRNYGQHTAVFCGLQKSSGDYVITLDDDLQNPPEEIQHLIEKAEQGHDFVCGRFRDKQHAQYRRWGSAVVGEINHRIFHRPKDFALTNFRMIRRDVVDRMCSYQTSYPYIPGLALMFSTNPANVWVEHHERQIGGSNYSFFKISQLVMRILFNYSSYPLRLVSVLGMIIAGFSLLLGVYFLLRAIFIGMSVPGWATVVVLLSLLNGFTILALGMLGEYTVRLLNQTSNTESYHVKEVITHRA